MTSEGAVRAVIGGWVLMASSLVAPAGWATEPVAERPVSAARPSPAALRAICADAFAGVARQDAPPTPIAIVPVDPAEPVAVFVVDYLHWCLGSERGVALVERARLDLLLRELETQRLLGAGDLTARVAALAGGESVLAVAVHPVDDHTRDITTRLTRLDGAAVLHATAPVRVEHRDLVELHRDLAARGSRLVAAGLSATLPGAGQLYNDAPYKAALFMAVEVGLVGAAIGLHVHGSAYEDAYHGGGPEDVYRAARAEDAYRTRNVLLWTALGVWVLGIADAAVFGGVRPDLDARYRERVGIGGRPGGAEVRWGGRF